MKRMFLISFLVFLCVSYHVAASAVEESRVLFHDDFAVSTAEITPGANFEGIDGYPCWQFSSPGLSFNPQQYYNVGVKDGRLNFIKATDRRETADYRTAFNARRSLGDVSTQSSEYEGKYILEFTVDLSSGGDVLDFQIETGEGTALIKGSINQPNHRADILNGDGTSTLQRNWIGYIGSVTLRLEIDTAKNCFRYYQGLGNAAPVLIVNSEGKEDRLYEMGNINSASLGSITFSTRADTVKGKRWSIVDIKFTEVRADNAFSISKPKFFEDSIADENIINEVQYNQHFEKVICNMPVKNTSDIERPITIFMGMFQDNRLVGISNVFTGTIDPGKSHNTELSIEGVTFPNKNAKLKVFVWNSFGEVYPVQNVKDLSINDLPIVKQRLQAAIYSKSTNPQTIMNDLGADGKFKSVSYTTDTSIAFGPSDALDKVKTMVTAYASIGNKWYQSSDLKAKIDLALTDWAENDYICKSNWWYNKIDVPTKMSDILIYDLPYNSRYTDKLFEISKRALPKLNPYAPHGSYDTGANMTDKLMVVLKTAIATNDVSILQDYVTALLELELRVYPSPQEGIMPDYSFQQHDQLLYSGSYGTFFVGVATKLIKYLKDTDFAVSDKALNVYADCILDGFQYMFRWNSLDFGIIGRAISRTSGVGGSTLKTRVRETANELLAMESVKRKDELQQLIARIDSGDNSINMTKHFYTSDYTVANRPNYFVGVRGASTRTKNTEFMNGENKKGYFLADGTTTIMRDGTEYQNIFPVWDWNKIPGTTTVQVEQIPTPVFELGGSSFVGGVASNNAAVSAVQLHKTRVTAQLDANKAYFIFDKGFVALGNSISSQLEREVVTSLNQTYQDGAVIYANDYGDKVQLADNTSVETQNVSWILHDNIGYVFTSPQNAVISNKVQTGSWRDINDGGSTSQISKKIFSAYISHGQKPSNQSYSYTVLPGTTQEEVANYVKNPTMSVISNDYNSSCVWDKDSKMFGAVFWKNGSVTLGKSITGAQNDFNITVSAPCVLMLDISGQKLSIADPNQTASAITVEINGQVFEISMPQGIHAGSGVEVNTVNIGG